MKYKMCRVKKQHIKAPKAHCAKFFARVTAKNAIYTTETYKYPQDKWLHYGKSSIMEMAILSWPKVGLVTPHFNWLDPTK